MRELSHMISLLDIKFTKEIFTEKELLKEIPVSRATFHRYKAEWCSKGGSLSEMGMFQLKNSRRRFWLAGKFLAWLVSHKVLDKGAFDYEQLDQEQSLLVVNKLEGLNDNR